MQTNSQNSSAKPQERRQPSYDRRRHEAIAQFPIITTQGICVRKDRRKIPDRRLSNITVREASIREEVFRTLFSSYLSIDKRGNYCIKKPIVNDGF